VKAPYIQINDKFTLYHGEMWKQLYCKILLIDWTVYIHKVWRVPSGFLGPVEIVDRSTKANKTLAKPLGSEFAHNLRIWKEREPTGDESFKICQFFHPLLLLTANLHTSSTASTHFRINSICACWHSTNSNRRKHWFISSHIQFLKLGLFTIYSFCLSDKRTRVEEGIK